MDKVESLLREFAAQIGVSVEYVWPHMVRYEFASACSVLIAVFLATLFFWVLGIWGLKEVRTDGFEGGKDFPTLPELAAGFGTTAAMIMSIILFTDIGLYLPTIIEPEGATMKMLLDKATR